MPRRIQRSRAKGWRMPEGAIYVGRPSKWGNPFHPGALVWVRTEWIEVRDIEHAIKLFKNAMQRRLIWPIEQRALTKLRGHDLACWCPLDQPCHADVLLDLANR
jgi:uncharacterized protein DUF4326